MSQEMCPLLRPCLFAPNSPCILPLVILGLELCSSLVLCQLAPCYTLPVMECRARLQGWRRKKGLAPSCFPFLSLLPSRVSSPRQQFLPIAAKESSLCFPTSCRPGFMEPISETPAPAEHTALQRCVFQLCGPSS